jgi:ubiquinone/menaquinone biosynthesis C-methylase UbiE
VTSAYHVHKAVACPVCKNGLHSNVNALECRTCRVEYELDGDIPCLFVAGAGRTVDAERLRLKSRAESVETTRLQRQIDFGLIVRPRHYYALYVALFITILARYWIASGIILTFFLVDWIFYRVRQARILDRFESNPLRLRTPDDFRAIDDLYERLGLPQPSMDDWARLAWESSGVAHSEADWRPQVAERYVEILEVYEAQRPRPRIVVDVGANDGQACWEFGIGADATVIGIDVSNLLLRGFREHLPEHVALQADGMCLPLKSESVDFLFCTETLEHLADPGEALAEFLRVLRPGGVLVAQSPNAHRLRNQNPLEILALPWSLVSDRVVRKKIVQENTWHNASTYHWDLSLQDYRRMLKSLPVGRQRFYSREFVFPQFLLAGHAERFRWKERALRALPILRYLGSDLVLVAEKSASTASPRRVRRREESREAAAAAAWAEPTFVRPEEESATSRGTRPSSPIRTR